MALKKFRSGALKNKYLSPELNRNELHFICFSGTEKFLAIFSPALIFYLVLSFVSRQKKVLLDAFAVPLNNKCNCFYSHLEMRISWFSATYLSLKVSLFHS